MYNAETDSGEIHLVASLHYGEEVVGCNFTIIDDEIPIDHALCGILLSSLKIYELPSGSKKILEIHSGSKEDLVYMNDWFHKCSTTGDEYVDQIVINAQHVASLKNIDVEFKYLDDDSNVARQLYDEGNSSLVIPLELNDQDCEYKRKSTDVTR